MRPRQVRKEKKIKELNNLVKKYGKLELKQFGPTYLENKFFINRVEIEQYTPTTYLAKILKPLPSNGIYLNKKTGHFEAWFLGKLITQRHYRRSQFELSEWKDRFFEWKEMRLVDENFMKFEKWLRHLKQKKVDPKLIFKPKEPFKPKVILKKKQGS